MADLLAIAERYGLECQHREISDEMQDVLAGEQEERSCEGEDASGMMYTMAMWSLVDTGKVDSIALTLTDVDGGGFEHIAIEFFGDVAATAASDPAFARTWIAENIYDVDVEETEIGGVHYVLRGWPEIDAYDSWSLDIEATPIE